MANIGAISEAGAIRAAESHVIDRVTPDLVETNMLTDGLTRLSHGPTILPTLGD